MLWRFRKKKVIEIDPEDVFMDSSNLPQFDTQQFEGSIEKPISKNIITGLFVSFVLVASVFIGRSLQLQIIEGKTYAAWSEDNSLTHKVILSDRGVIYDRNGIPLAFNGESRTYLENGFSHIVGYIGRPNEEELKTGLYVGEDYIGKAGIEKLVDDMLRGQTGIMIEEADVKGNIKSNYLLKEPINGENVKLTIDSRVQTKLYGAIRDLALDKGFQGGSGVILDVNTGEVLAMTSYPEYDSNVLSLGEDKESINKILQNKDNPFLNRAVSGLYTPGSIVKPFMATAALSEDIINPDKQILSTGSITVPNPFFPDKPSVFRDWKAHGLVDMRRALAVSSNVYFYEIGGGFGGQRGLGIDRINKYMRMFGFGKPTELLIGNEPAGTIPNPEWKIENFDGEEWRIGDTYYTSIGQYGFQVTPLQVALAIGAIANGGRLMSPSLILTDSAYDSAGQEIKLDKSDLQIVREGMRLGVREGTTVGLNLSGVSVAAKSGTAELGESKARVNSWVTGFFPYESPKYAFVVVMESGRVENLVGATFVMRQVIEWMLSNTPEYLNA